MMWLGTCLCFAWVDTKMNCHSLTSCYQLRKGGAGSSQDKSSLLSQRKTPSHTDSRRLLTYQSPRGLRSTARTPFSYNLFCLKSMSGIGAKLKVEGPGARRCSVLGKVPAVQGRVLNLDPSSHINPECDSMPLSPPLGWHRGRWWMLSRPSQIGKLQIQ